MADSIGNQVDYESMISKTYGTGLYQILLTCLFSMTSFMYALDLQSMIFMHYSPSFTCSNDELNLASEVIWLSYRPNPSSPLTSPSPNSTDNSVNQCWALIRNQTSQTYTTFTCTKWNFDNKTMLNTVVTQFNLVCDSEYWIPMFEASVLFFNAIGFLLSSTTDLIGRQIPFISLCSLEVILNILTPFAWCPISFLILRCMHGITAGTGYIGIIVAMELVPHDKRAVYGTVYWLNFSLGYMVAGCMAYWLRDWSKLRLWYCFFNLTYLSYPYFVCDTPRWLGLKNKTKQALDLIKRLARWNKVQLDSDYFNKVEEFLQNDSLKQRKQINLPEKSSQTDRFLDIFLNSEIRKRTIVIVFVHTGLAMVYFGLITDKQFASSDIFLNVLLLGLVEIPANFAGWKAADIVGRRLSTALLLWLTCLAVLGAGGFKNIHSVVQCIFAIFGKFVLTVSYCVADLYIVELYPTTLRNRGMFLTVTLAGFGSTLSPYVNQLYLEWEYLPYAVYGALCIISGLLVYFLLPETKDQPLCQTIEQSTQSQIK